jgi:hypothetical protein
MKVTVKNIISIKYIHNNDPLSRVNYYNNAIFGYDIISEYESPLFIKNKHTLIVNNKNGKLWTKAGYYCSNYSNAKRIYRYLIQLGKVDIRGMDGIYSWDF